MLMTLLCSLETMFYLLDFKDRYSQYTACVFTFEGGGLDVFWDHCEDADV